MNNIFVNLILYVEEKEKQKNLEKAVKELGNKYFLSINNIFDKGNKGKCYYYEIYCSCYGGLNYDKINAFAKEQGVKWASVEQDFKDEIYIVNDEFDMFFDDIVLQSYDLLNLTNCYFSSTEDFLNYMIECDYIEPAKIEIVRNEMEDRLENDGIYHFKKEYVKNELIKDWSKEELENYFFKIKLFEYNIANFWWNEREENNYE